VCEAPERAKLGAHRHAPRYGVGFGVDIFDAQEFGERQRIGLDAIH